MHTYTQRSYLSRVIFWELGKSDRVKKRGFFCRGERKKFREFKWRSGFDLFFHDWPTLNTPFFCMRRENGRLNWMKRMKRLRITVSKWSIYFQDSTLNNIQFLNNNSKSTFKEHVLNDSYEHWCNRVNALQVSTHSRVLVRGCIICLKFLKLWKSHFKWRELIRLL